MQVSGHRGPDLNQLLACLASGSFACVLTFAIDYTQFVVAGQLNMRDSRMTCFTPTQNSTKKLFTLEMETTPNGLPL